MKRRSFLALVAAAPLAALFRGAPQRRSSEVVFEGADWSDGNAATVVGWAVTSSDNGEYVFVEMWPPATCTGSSATDWDVADGYFRIL